MSRYTQKKVQYRSKDDGVKSRFGYEYNEQNINYRTQIPAIPDKPKNRPDDKIRDKKIAEVEEKIKKIKEQRKEKKERVKVLNEAYDLEIEAIKENVQLGKKCILVLNSDIQFIQYEIVKVNRKIQKRKVQQGQTEARLRQLRGTNKRKKVYKKHEEMTIRELDDEKNRITLQMSTKDLNKRQETEYSQLLNKLQRLKLDTDRQIVQTQEPVQPNSADIQELQRQIAQDKEKVSKLYSQRKVYYQRREDIQFKIQCIQQDIVKFIQDVKQVAEKEMENVQVKALIDQSKELKGKLEHYKEEINRIEKQYDERVVDYEQEQEKIKWINWATNIQNAKREQWEEEKAQKKRQKLKEKGAGAGATSAGDKKTDGKTKQQGGNTDNREYRQERKINRNQKQIDACSFLIQYCKRLIPTQSSQTAKLAKTQVNIQQVLKKGAWAKEKGIEVITSKKKRLDEEEQPTKTSHKRRDQQKEEQIVPSNRISHEYFIAQFFDTVNVLPPTKVEQLEKIIKDLQDKLEYYLSHPDEGVEKKFAQDKQYVDKTVKGEEKPKAREGRSNIVNSEDFPSIS